MKEYLKFRRNINILLNVNMKKYNNQERQK